MRVVFDTSTSFSAIAFNGSPARVLEALFASDEWEIATSPKMRDELQRTLSKKGLTSPLILEKLRRYFSLCILVQPREEIAICRDSTDDFILDCALAAEANLIISSDQDLLVLSRDLRIRGIEIISVAEAIPRFVTGLGMGF